MGLFGKKKKKGLFDIITAGFSLASSISDSVQSKGGDFGLDWYCDNCNTYMNSQPGFSAGDTWICKKCGYENDVSANNILETSWEEDENGHLVEITHFPGYDYEDEDPEDY